MNKFINYNKLAIIFLLLSACSVTQPNKVQIKQTFYFDDYFSQYQSIPIESEAEVFGLDEEMKEVVRTKLLTEKDFYKRANKLVKHIFSQDYVNLAYQNTANLTASQTYHSQIANCLSLTIMSYALAKEAGLSVDFQDVQIPEYWVRNGQYNMLTGHVNLLIRKPLAANVAVIWGRAALQIDFDPYILRNSFTKVKVDKPTILAMFYTNIGAQAIVDGEYTKAYAYLKQATLVSPFFDPAWTNLGILYRMVNNYPLAEKTYRYALTLDPNNLTILNNLAMLMKKQGFIDKSIEIETSIHNKRIKNPYYHALLGDEALYRGNGTVAKSHYKKAIKLNHKNHEFYYGLAKAYYQLDEYENAQETLEKAIKLNKAKSTEHQYIAKLEWMKASAINEY